MDLGFWLWCGYASQAIGLVYTSVGRSAFITSLNLVFVPTIVALGGRRIPIRLWISAGLALVGTALLCHDQSGGFNRGDLWTLVTAVTYAAYIVRLEKYANRFETMRLTAAQLCSVAVLSVAWAGFDLHGSITPDLARTTETGWICLLYLGIAATAVTTWLQALGQRSVSGPAASLLYTMEPVWATGFAWAVAGEHPGLIGGLGACLILIAAAWSQVRSYGGRSNAAG